MIRGLEKDIKICIAIVTLSILTGESYIFCQNDLRHTKQSVMQYNVDTLDIKNDTAIVFLNLSFKNRVYVYDKPNGKILKSIKQDSANVDYLMFMLLKREKNMFFVRAYSSLDGRKIIDGWIDKNYPLGIYSSVYNNDLKLFKLPYDRKKTVAKHIAYSPNAYKVIDFYGNWLLVKFRINNKIMYGWMPPECQCNNVYSTCS